MTPRRNLFCVSDIDGAGSSVSSSLRSMKKGGVVREDSHLILWTSLVAVRRVEVGKLDLGALRAGPNCSCEAMKL